MFAEIAILALCLAFMLKVIAGSSLLSGKIAAICNEFVEISSFLSAALVFLAFTALIILRIDSDFTVANVVDHSNRTLPLLYKITGSWGNHEGSMLLLALVISGYGIFLARLLAQNKNTQNKNLENENTESKDTESKNTENENTENNNADISTAEKLIHDEKSIHDEEIIHDEKLIHDKKLISNEKLIRTSLAIQSLLGAGILLFILATSNPFRRIFPPPADGAMLNPLLQDVALALHPPFLYLGYVGFSAVFSLAVAALICGKIDRNWAVIAHPFIMFSWSMLTVGITLGSWWAYRELGWGGFWFWDPVENASLLPWLAATALLHSNIALSKRGIFSRLVALLAIGTFALSLIGIFLVRSGVITSVHSFANDPQRGIYILCYIAVVIGSALYLYARADKAFLSAAPLRPVSREGMIALNNLFLLTACATLLLGTLYPLLVDALGWQAISIGAPYFNRTILPLIAAGLLFAGLVAFVPWKKGRVVRILQRSWLAWILAALVLLLILSGIGLSSKAFAAAAGFALAAWLLGGSADWLADGRWRRFSQWPVFLAHVGMAVLVVGITGCGLWSRQSDLAVSPGDNFSFVGYKVIFSKLEQVTNPNYDATRAVLIISRAEGKSRHLMPEYRSYAISGSFTSEAAIYSTLAYDFYAVIGETNAEGKTALRLYYKPTISCLWLGASLVSLGGLFAAFASIKAARRRTK